MARRRPYRRRPYGRRPARGRRGIPVGPVVAGLSMLALGAWWLTPDADPPPSPADLLAAPSPMASPLTDRPDPTEPKARERGRDHRRPSRPKQAPAAGIAASKKRTTPQAARPSAGGAPADASSPTAEHLAELVRAGDAALADKNLLAARERYSEAMLAEIQGANRTRVRSQLIRIGRETIFSPRTFAGDTLVSRYTIKTGDTLGKIAKTHRVSADLLASINDIQNVNLIRAGQVIKVVQGPFRAIVHKREYSLDVYLSDTFVAHFDVGLGADDGTPTGSWQVATKLKNPTYYPPRGGRMIAADDPENPLGERWIALKGVAGNALGAQRYGIHGTIDPNSIGSSMSLGCIRMHNSDVELLYTYLVENHSTVEVLE